MNDKEIGNRPPPCDLPGSTERDQILKYIDLLKEAFTTLSEPIEEDQIEFLLRYIWRIIDGILTYPEILDGPIRDKDLDSFVIDALRQIPQWQNPVFSLFADFVSLFNNIVYHSNKTMFPEFAGEILNILFPVIAVPRVATSACQLINNFLVSNPEVCAGFVNMGFFEAFVSMEVCDRSAYWGLAYLCPILCSEELVVPEPLRIRVLPILKEISYVNPDKYGLAVDRLLRLGCTQINKSFFEDDMDITVFECASTKIDRESDPYSLQCIRAARTVIRNVPRDYSLSRIPLDRFLAIIPDDDPRVSIKTKVKILKILTTMIDVFQSPDTVTHFSDKLIWSELGDIMDGMPFDVKKEVLLMYLSGARYGTTDQMVSLLATCNFMAMVLECFEPDELPNVKHFGSVLLKFKETENLYQLSELYDELNCAYDDMSDKTTKLACLFEECIDLMAGEIPTEEECF